MTTQNNVRLACAAFSLLTFCLCPTASAYSVLTHEAIVDSTWDSAIKPLLVKRFPAATTDDLTAAHGYAYGGCIIQDLGYYPFGSKFYSDLTHYVRSGDFILSLIRESQDLDEYAFALGALAHYAADNNGHRMATNLSVPLLYPKLRVKFGKSITHADDPFSDSMCFKRPRAATPRMLTKASSVFKSQNPCSNAPSRTLMESGSRRYS
jgi:hypothetical protein